MQARGDATLYLTQKFVRRNRVAVAAAILCTLFVGFVEVARARDRAERRFNDVRQLAHSVMFDYSDAIDWLPGATPVRARLVQDALRYLDNLSKEADVPALQQEIVDAYVRVSNVQGNEYQNNMGRHRRCAENSRQSRRGGGKTGGEAEDTCRPELRRRCFRGRCIFALRSGRSIRRRPGISACNSTSRAGAE